MGAAVKLSYGSGARSEAVWSDVPLSAFSPGLPTQMTMSGADLLDVDYRPFAHRHPGWLGAVGRVLVRELANDTSRGRLAAATQLLRLLADTVWSSAPAPFVSPTGHAGFSAEFLAHGVEVHLEASEQDGSSIYVYEPNGVEWEGPVASVPDGLEKWAWKLTHA